MSSFKNEFFTVFDEIKIHFNPFHPTKQNTSTINPQGGSKIDTKKVEINYLNG